MFAQHEHRGRRVSRAEAVHGAERSCSSEILNVRGWALTAGLGSTLSSEVTSGAFLCHPQLRGPGQVSITDVDSHNNGVSQGKSGKVVHSSRDNILAGNFFLPGSLPMKSNIICPSFNSFN